MKTAHVIFADPDYNYSTSINGTEKEIKKYFIGRRFNLGGISYDHENCQEIEIDNMRTCTDCIVEN